MEDEMGRDCGTNGKNRNAHVLLVGKLEEKRAQGRQRRWWVVNIKMNFGERDCVGMD
jgi:hypothetical protein